MWFKSTLKSTRTLSHRLCCREVNSRLRSWCDMGLGFATTVYSTCRRTSTSFIDIAIQRASMSSKKVNTVSTYTSSTKVNVTCCLRRILSKVRTHLQVKSRWSTSTWCWTLWRKGPFLGTYPHSMKSLIYLESKYAQMRLKYSRLTWGSSWIVLGATMVHLWLCYDLISSWKRIGSIWRHNSCSPANINAHHNCTESVTWTSDDCYVSTTRMTVSMNAMRSHPKSVPSKTSTTMWSNRCTPMNKRNRMLCPWVWTAGVTNS